MVNASVLTDGVIFSGSLSATYSGGIELTQEARGFFFNTTFRRCRWDWSGGALNLRGGSTAELGTGSEFIGNIADQGGAIYIGAGCTVQVNSTIHFYNNSANPYSGGAFFLESGAQLTMGRYIRRFRPNTHSG